MLHWAMRVFTLLLSVNGWIFLPVWWESLKRRRKRQNKGAIDSRLRVLFCMCWAAPLSRSSVLWKALRFKKLHERVFEHGDRAVITQGKFTQMGRDHLLTLSHSLVDSPECRRRTWPFTLFYSRTGLQDDMRWENTNAEGWEDVLDLLIHIT